jgi:TonB family protein
MSEQKKNKKFTAADIEKYHKGLLSSQAMHELEKAALEDPFFADALEGYGSMSTNASADLAELHQKLEQRISGSRVVAISPTRNLFKWWSVAAAVVILGGIGFLTFKLSTSEKQNSIAELNKRKPDQAPAPVSTDSNKLTTIDSTSITKDGTAIDTVATVRSAKKPHVKSTAKRTDTSIYADSSRTSVGSEVAKESEHKIDSVSDKAGLETNVIAAPMAQKKAEARTAQPVGVLNDEQTRVQSQMNNFTGRVVDASNNAIPFANIIATRNNLETYADARGYFSLTAHDSVLNVSVRSVGFENGVTKLKDNAYNQVVLQDDKTAPDKVLAVRNSEVNKSRASTMQLEQPEPVDGWTNYSMYMANNINLPEDSKIGHDNAQVQVSFDVNEQGEPVNVKVDKSLCKKCDEEAMRLVKQGPKWRQKNKKAKRATVTVPFHAR